MTGRKLHNTLMEPGKSSFLLLVAAAYISTFALGSRVFLAWEVYLLLGLGILYVAADFWGLPLLYAYIPRYAALVYFSVQIPIIAAVQYLSRGNAWLMVMPLVSEAIQMLSWRGVFLVNTLLYVILTLNIRLLTDDWGSIIQSSVAFLAAILFVSVFTQILMKEKKARAEVQRLADELNDANRRLREYAIQVEELAATQERNRLAREIHDGLGHYLTSVHMQIKAAAAVMEREPKRAAEALEKATSLSQDALADVRRSVAALRGEPMLSKPLPDMLQTLVSETCSSGLVVELALNGTPRLLNSQTELTVYRAVQEGLTNVRKHALASRVDVNLDFQPEKVRLVIQDNGVGMTFQEDQPVDKSGGFGLFGLRERVQYLGGRLDFGPAADRGCRLEIELPG